MQDDFNRIPAYVRHRPGAQFFEPPPLAPEPYRVEVWGVAPSKDIHNASPPEIAWLAGLLEGEGCFSLRESRSGSVKLGIVCVSTDLDVLGTVQRIAGCGNIRKHNANRGQENPAWKPAYRWSTWKREEVARLLGLVLPFMHTRRKAKAEEMLHALTAN